MSDYKRIEVFTSSLPVDMVEPFTVVASSSDGTRVDARLGGERNHVSLRKIPEPNRPEQRVPCVVVGLDNELSDTPAVELATRYAQVVVFFILRPDVDGGLVEDLDECRYLTWERGGPVVVNSHPYVATTPLGQALVTALDGAGIAWVGEDLGLYMLARAWFSLPEDGPPYPPALWSDWHEAGMVVFNEWRELASLVGVEPGVEQVSYVDFEVDPAVVAVFVDRLLSQLVVDPGLVGRYRSTIVRVVAMALRTGFEPGPDDPVVAGIVADARTHD